MKNILRLPYALAIVLCLGIIFPCWGSREEKEESFDLTVVSSIDFNGSVRRHAIGLIDCLKDELNINFIPSRPVNLDDVNSEVKNIVLRTAKTPGRVALLEDPLWYADSMPESEIKIAYSVYESTRIPQAWVKLLNEKFDAVVVADKFYIKVYEESGVKIPIFHIPLGIYVDEFLELPLKKKTHKPFVFRGCSRFFRRKNHSLLIQAFAREFGNSKDVVLKINGGGKWGSEKLYSNLKSLVKKLKVSNIQVTNNALPWKDYIEMMSSIDCYVNISRGEGFSITPRETLAMGIPTILSDNTAQKTICETDFVKAIRSDIGVPAYCGKVNERVGYQFDCRLADVQKALREVYENYSKYLAKAHQGREWVKQFRWPSLKNKYLNLIKPKIIKFGDYNEITDEYFMTNSKKLYKKYLELQKISQEEEFITN